MPRILLLMLLALVSAAVIIPVAYYVLAVIGSRQAVNHYYGA